MEEITYFLKKVGCDERIIRNVIMSNESVLSRSVSDLEKLVAKLREIGLTDIVDLIDANPYILNLDAYEIDDYIKKKEEFGESFDEIVDALESEPALFMEIQEQVGLEIQDSDLQVHICYYITFLGQGVEKLRWIRYNAQNEISSYY